MNNSIFTVELSLSEFFVHKYGAGDNEIKFNSKIEIFLLVTLFLFVSSQSVLNNTFRVCTLQFFLSLRPHSSTQMFHNSYL